MSKICANCGAEYPDKANFCGKCGTKFEPQEVHVKQNNNNQEVVLQKDDSFSLFSFSGCISRKTYWAIHLLTTAIILYLGLFFLILKEGFSNIDFSILPFTENSIVFFAVSIAIVWGWIGLATSLKRLRDANFSPWMILLNLIPYLGVFIVFIMNAFMPSLTKENKYCKTQNNLSSKALNWIYVISFLIPFLLLIVGLIVNSKTNIAEKNNITEKTNIPIVVDTTTVQKSSTTKEVKSIEDYKNWEYKEWKIDSLDNNMINYSTHGTRIHGDRFGFIKRKDSCEDDLIYFNVSTFNENLNRFKGSYVKFIIKIDGKVIEINPELVDVYPFLKSLNIVSFSNVHANPIFLELLKKGSTMSISIVGPKYIIEYFDKTEEEYNLNGFVATHLKSYEICKKAL